MQGLLIDSVGSLPRFKGGDIDATYCWEECQRICSHVLKLLQEMTARFLNCHCTVLFVIDRNPVGDTQRIFKNSFLVFPCGTVG